MRTNILKLLCCLLAACSFTACDDDEGIRFMDNVLVGDVITGQEAVSHVELFTLGVSTLTVAGGTLPYQVSVADPALLTATVEGGDLRLEAAGEEGATEVTLTDKNGRTATLTVAIRAYRMQLAVAAIQTKVLDTEGNPADEATAQAIADDIAATSRIQPGNVIVLERKTRTETGEKGALRIYADNSESTEGMKEGTYVQDVYPELQAYTFTLRYDGVEETYFLNHPTAAHPDIPETREVGPIPFLLGRNVTSRYQADYPGVGTVVYALSGYVRH